MNPRRELGIFGEDAAAGYLLQNGFRIVARNFRSGHNEIDIIAENDHFLVFAEVKARDSQAKGNSNYGRPSSAVDAHKQRCTVACAQAFLRAHPTDKQPRMDVIEVYAGKRYGVWKVLSVYHIENAYGG